jgi:KTSC domain-containing protein
MRARDRELPPGLGAEHGVACGLVGIGDALPVAPATLGAAIAAAAEAHGDKAARMLDAFAELSDGAFVWTHVTDGTYRLGRIAGPWRYDDSPAAHAVGIHHVRPAQWLDRRLVEDEVPGAVAHTFARGGRNFQRVHDEPAERRTAALWDEDDASRDGWHACDSTAVRAFRHLPGRGVLQVVFDEGRLVYDYPCPDALYERFLRADSKGGFVNQVLKPHAERQGWSPRPYAWTR